MTSIVLWTLISCFFLPLAGLFFMVHLNNWQSRRRAGRIPISEKLLRPPGESLRLKIEDLAQKLSDALLFAIVFPAGVTAAFVLQAPIEAVSKARLLSGAILEVILFVPIACYGFGIARKLKDHRLGFLGERAVGEEINQLMLEGCRVYHDVPMEPYGNIDHIIVAESGVYAVETKTRRKKMISGKRIMLFFMTGFHSNTLIAVIRMGWTRRASRQIGCVYFLIKLWARLLK